MPYFTFGQIHEHVIDGVILNKDTVIYIGGDDARKKMVKLFGSEWSNEYEECPDMSYFKECVYL